MRRLAICLLLALPALPAAAGAATLRTVDIPSNVVDESTANFNAGGALKANVLLPDGYDRRKTYPLLVLLHGAGDTYQSWAAPGKGDIRATAAGLKAIVVMPDGATGFYASWFNGGQRGNPEWERYVLEEVLSYARSHYRIRPQRRFHAIAGLSMGGLGATFLGGRLPGYFGTVASFSGFVDHQRAEVSAGGLQAVAGVSYERIFGPVTGFYATGHNPTRIPGNLARSRLFVGVGDGTVDPVLGTGSPSAAVAGGAVEVEIRTQVEAFVAAARKAGVPVTYEPHAGVHDWPYWRKDLRAAIGHDLFAPVAERPRAWTNTTVAAAGELFGFRYAFSEPPRGLVRIERSGTDLRVSGPRVGVTLTTPGGCELQGTLPLSVTITRARCRRLRVSVAPRRVRVGRRVTLRVRAGRPGAVVSAAGRTATADDGGLALITVRYRRPGLRRVRARSPDRLPGHARLTIVSRPRPASAD